MTERESRAAKELHEIVFKEPMPSFIEMEGAGTATWKRPDGTTIEMNAAVSEKLADEFLERKWILLDD